MILFISIAGLMTIVSWWLVVRPLLSRPAAAEEPASVAQLKQQIAQLDALHQSGALSAEHHRESRGALEKKLAEAVVAAPPAAAPAVQRSLGLAIGLAVFMVAVVGGGYWLVGTPAALGTNPAAVMAAAGNDGGAGGNAGGNTGEGGGAQHPMSFEKIQAMAEGLAARLKEDPSDATGWAMLARSYMVLGRYPEAVPAFKRATALVHDDAQLYADYADALAMANDRNLSGEPMTLVAQALKIDPNNLKALTLAGTDAFERKDYATTIKDWEKVAQLGANDSEFVQQVRQGIAEARDLAAKAGVKVPPPSTPAAATPPAGAPAMAAAGVSGVSGRVSLSAALAKQVSPDDTVFVFARAAQGPRMPLAIVRKQVKDLPFDFTLDDSTAMSPQMKLSNFEQVVVGARISKSGNAMPQPGDLQGISPTVSLGAAGLKIEIAEVVK